MNVAMRLRAKAYSGDRKVALELLTDRQEMLPRVGRTNSYGSWGLLIAAIEGLYLLGEREKVAALYPLALGLVNTGAICVLIMSRFPQTIAGIASTAAYNWEPAEEHFEMAMQQAESFPNVLEQADIRRFHAMMLIDRAVQGDRARARALLGDALQSYQRIGMHGHAELTQALISQADS
jgi:hypothetical protein